MTKQAHTRELAALIAKAAPGGQAIFAYLQRWAIELAPDPAGAAAIRAAVTAGADDADPATIKLATSLLNALGPVMAPQASPRAASRAFPARGEPGSLFADVKPADGEANAEPAGAERQEEPDDEPTSQSEPIDDEPQVERDLCEPERERDDEGEPEETDEETCDEPAETSELDEDEEDEPPSVVIRSLGAERCYRCGEPIRSSESFPIEDAVCHFGCERQAYVAGLKDHGISATDYQIEPLNPSRRSRAFGAVLLASVDCDGLWATDESAARRPAWCAWGGTEEQLRPFVANLRLGMPAVASERIGRRKRRNDEAPIMLPRKAGYQFAVQREVEGAIATVFLPRLFRLDPGMVDPAGVAFLLMQSCQWMLAQTIDGERRIFDHVRAMEYDIPAGDVARLIPLSFLFAAYLDRRTRLPLLCDGRFYVQVMLESLREGLATLGGVDTHTRAYGLGGSGPRLREQGSAALGMLPPLAFKATHEEIEAMLGQQVKRFVQLTSKTDEVCHGRLAC